LELVQAEVQLVHARLDAGFLRPVRLVGVTPGAAACASATGIVARRLHRGGQEVVQLLQRGAGGAVLVPLPPFQLRQLALQALSIRARGRSGVAVGGAHGRV